MPTLNEIRNAIDARLTALWPQIVTRQNTYFGAQGKYFQGIATPSTLPADGGELTTDLTLRPHDQVATWAAANFNLGAAIPMRIAFDTYTSADGAGYVGRVWVSVLGATWTRAQGAGPDADAYTHAWREVE